MSVPRIELRDGGAVVTLTAIGPATVLATVSLPAQGAETTILLSVGAGGLREALAAVLDGPPVFTAVSVLLAGVAPAPPNPYECDYCSRYVVEVLATDDGRDVAAVCEVHAPRVEALAAVAGADFDRAAVLVDVAHYHARGEAAE